MHNCYYESIPCCISWICLPFSPSFHPTMKLLGGQALRQTWACIPSGGHRTRQYLMPGRFLQSTLKFAVDFLSFSLLLITQFRSLQNYALTDRNKKAHVPFSNHLFPLYLYRGKKHCLLSFVKYFKNSLDDI